MDGNFPTSVAKDPDEVQNCKLQMAILESLRIFDGYFDSAC